MTTLFTIAAIGAAIVITLVIRSLVRKRRRTELLTSPLPSEWEEAIAHDFPRYRAVPEEIKERLGGCARILAEEKSFEACGGLEEVTERMKALICIQAALLIVNLPHHRFFPALKSILVYPGAFRDRGHRRFGIHAEDRGTVLGESWETGSVILSWDNCLAGARNADDGLNVVIHEFAHQLDQINGAADGLPVLSSGKAYRRWAEVFHREFEELVEDVNDGRGPKPLIDPYGATEPAEFFAVASETFFEESHELREEHPDLYEQLCQYYRLDPATWEE